MPTQCWNRFAFLPTTGRRPPTRLPVDKEYEVEVIHEVNRDTTSDFLVVIRQDCGQYFAHDSGLFEKTEHVDENV